MIHDNKALRKAAQERMERLFELAYNNNLKGRDDDLSKKYIKIARSISSHYKIKMPIKIKQSICKKCDTVLIPGKTCKVILASSSKSIIYICKCGHRNRIIYTKKKG